MRRSVLATIERANYAAWFGRVDFVKSSLQKEGLDPDKARDIGATPLFITAYKGHVDVVKALLTRPNLDLDCKFNNETPLVAACRLGHNTTATLLRTATSARDQSNPNNKFDNSGKTRLMKAIDTKATASVSAMLRRPELKPDLAGDNGRTALHYAARQHSLDTSQSLLTLKASCNRQTTDNATPLHAAAHIRVMQAR